MDSWDSWIQSIGKTAVDAYAANAAADRAYEVQRLQLQQQAAASMPAAGGVSPAMLLIGGAVLVAVLVMSDRK